MYFVGLILVSQLVNIFIVSIFSSENGGLEFHQFFCLTLVAGLSVALTCISSVATFCQYLGWEQIGKG